MSSGENRTKIELPKLDWAYDTYVQWIYNAAIESLFAAEAKGDVKAAIAIQQNIKFHGGGHTNHVLFWKTLAPPSQGEERFHLPILLWVSRSKNSTAGPSSQKNTQNGNTLDVVTTFNQDTLLDPLVPLLAIDAWEHAYYLQYQNVKADYFKAIWNVINWAEAERRFKRNTVDRDWKI
ncbi:hypothetical protein G9P44_005962 [Scheffersomyces stipitis]|nr:hypothetical protein G9P44_005962 [Scheffersomyces stipitis]